MSTLYTKVCGIRQLVELPVLFFSSFVDYSIYFADVASWSQVSILHRIYRICISFTCPSFVSDIAIFVLKRGVKLQLTN